MRRLPPNSNVPRTRAQARGGLAAAAAFLGRAVALSPEPTRRAVLDDTCGNLIQIAQLA